MKVAFVSCFLTILFPVAVRSASSNGNETVVLSGCTFASENMCDIHANVGCAYQFQDTFRSVISTSRPSYVSCALLVHHILT